MTQQPEATTFERFTRPARGGEPGFEIGQDVICEVAGRPELVADPAVGDLAGEPCHLRPDRGEIDRDRLASRAKRPLPPPDAHPLARSFVLDRLAPVARADEAPQDLNRVAHAGHRAREIRVVPVGDQPPDARSESQDEPSRRELIEIEGRECERHRAPGEGPGDARPNLTDRVAVAIAARDTNGLR